jgi:sulfotransferase
LHLDSDAKILVPIRELGQIYGSIEAQHQKTILLDFIDHLADYDRFGRADQLFAQDKSIGAPLSSIRAVQELPQTVKDRLYFVKFEDLVAHPVETMERTFKWLGVSAHKIDPKKLTVRPHESDSHYRNKYLHRQQAKLAPPKHHDIPLRIQEHIERVCGWYYEWFYPEFKRRV